MGLYTGSLYSEFCSLEQTLKTIESHQKTLFIATVVINNRTPLRNIYINSFDSVDFSCIFKLGFSSLQAIDINLKLIYENKVIATFMSREDIKDMLVSCNKNVHLSMNSEIYLHIDSVTKGSLLRSVLAGIS